AAVFSRHRAARRRRARIARPTAHQPDLPESALTLYSGSMTTTELKAESADVTTANRTGVYLAVLQLVFTLRWTTYVIYLPKLAAEVGIEPSWVILILMLDQAIFTITDTAMGIAADRVAKLVGRLSLFVGVLTAISCVAFLALPFVAGAGPGAQAW